MADLSDEIETAASQPKRVTTDAGSVEQHSLPDLIAADKHLKGEGGVDRPHLGLRFAKWRPPGAA